MCGCILIKDIISIDMTLPTHPIYYKLGFTCEDNTSPKGQTPWKGSICPELQSGQGSRDDDKLVDELPSGGF